MTCPPEVGTGGYPRVDSVDILMSVSASGWHRERMMMTGGTGPEPGGTAWAGAVASTVLAPAPARVAQVTGMLAAGVLLTDVAIVIAGSPGFPLIRGARRVLCAAVIQVLVATVRATRLAADRALEPAVIPSGPAPAPRLRGAA